MTALKIEKLTKIYRQKLLALNDISLEVEQGDFFGLLGPNGAGKSTAIGIVTTLVNKTRGKVFIHGFDLDHTPERAKCFVGVVPQEFNFNMFEKVLDELINQAGYYGVSRQVAYGRCEQYLTQLGIWEKRNELLRNLSGGMKRRFMIVRALLHNPEILILDEPTAGVDIELRRSMWSFLTELNAQGKTIILTTHYLEEAENLCRRIAIIHQGEIIANAPTKDLVKKLGMETFILDLEEPLTAAPQLAKFQTRLIEPQVLEVQVHIHENISAVFHELERTGILVKSLKNKANRLEELFLQLISNHHR